MNGNVVIESILQEPAKHAASLATTSTGMATGDILGAVAACAGIFLTCYLIYKTHLDIKLTKIKLAREDRRNAG